MAMTRRLSLLAATFGALLSLASPASAAQRYAAPTSTDVVGSCSAMAPCRLDHAVSGASAGDEVIVQSGIYTLASAVSASVPVNIHGVMGQRRPRLVAPAGLGAAAVSLGAGGSISYLAIVKNDSGDALELNGAIGSTLLIKHSAGVGATLRGAAILRDSVVRVTGADPAMETKDGSGGGVPKLLNVTVLATDPGADAIKVKQTAGPLTVRNSVVRGGTYDVRVFPRSSVGIDHSNFRPAASSAYTDGGGNSSADPLLDGYALQAGSPAIDTGIADADLGSLDIDVAQRPFGAGPDMGAFEFGAPRSNWDDWPDPAPDTPTGGDGSNETDGNRISPPVPPKAGKRMNVGPVKGTIKVRTPGADGFVELGDDASIPVNSVIDATHGVVELTTVRGGGDNRTQTGRFWGGRFQVKQRKSGAGYTELVLKGGNFKQCSAPGHAKAVAAGRKRAVRQLWGQDNHGRFRSHGRRGQATVRGTKWLTQDRCDGTLFAVRKGAIAVKAKGVRKAVLLRAGQRYLARVR
jgi:hypothetical protein